MAPPGNQAGTEKTKVALNRRAGNPRREAWLNWQESAEAEVPQKGEGPNMKRGERGE